MRITGKEDLRVQKTIAAIKEAFEELICEKEYADITVTELCARSKINKKTFYHYYPTLDDLLVELQLELSSEYLELVRDFTLPEDSAKVNRVFFEYSAAQGLAYEKITCSTGAYSKTRQEMIDRVTEQTWGRSKRFHALSAAEQNMVLNYVSTVSVGCYRQWVADGKQMPLEEVIQLSTALMCGGLDGFFKTNGGKKHG